MQFYSDFCADRAYSNGIWLEESQSFSAQCTSDETYHHIRPNVLYKISCNGFPIGEGLSILDVMELLYMFVNNQLSTQREAYEFRGWRASCSRNKEEGYLWFIFDELNEDGEPYEDKVIDKLTARIVYSKLQRMLKHLELEGASGYRD